jgi:hypothetical protein
MSEMVAILPTSELPIYNSRLGAPYGPRSSITTANP